MLDSARDAGRPGSATIDVEPVAAGAAAGDSGATTGSELAALPGMDLEALRRFWRRRWGPAPALRAPDLLRLMIAWRLQAEAWGGLDASSRRALARRGPVIAEGLDLGPGTILRRAWEGVVHEVEVEAGGFRWNGVAYASLSAVATAIAGTRWNGPRFFGLRDQKRSSR